MTMTLTTSGATSASSSGCPPKCYCNWRNCWTWQQIFCKMDDELWNGVIQITWDATTTTTTITTTASNMADKRHCSDDGVNDDDDTGHNNIQELKDAWDMLLHVDASKRRHSQYYVARHHFTETLITRLLEQQQKRSTVSNEQSVVWNWNERWTKREAEEYYGSLPLNTATYSHSSEDDLYLQVPNVPRKEVRARIQQLRRREGDNENDHEEEGAERTPVGNEDHTSGTPTSTLLNGQPTNNVTVITPMARNQNQDPNGGSSGGASGPPSFERNITSDTMETKLRSNTTTRRHSRQDDDPALIVLPPTTRCSIIGKSSEILATGEDDGDGKTDSPSVDVSRRHTRAKDVPIELPTSHEDKLGGKPTNDTIVCSSDNNNNNNNNNNQKRLTGETKREDIVPPLPAASPTHNRRFGTSPGVFQKKAPQQSSTREYSAVIPPARTRRIRHDDSAPFVPPSLQRKPTEGTATIPLLCDTKTTSRHGETDVMTPPALPTSRAAPPREGVAENSSISPKGRAHHDDSVPFIPPSLERKLTVRDVIQATTNAGSIVGAPMTMQIERTPMKRKGPDEDVPFTPPSFLQQQGPPTTDTNFKQTSRYGEPSDGDDDGDRDAPMVPNNSRGTSSNSQDDGNTTVRKKVRSRNTRRSLTPPSRGHLVVVHNKDGSLRDNRTTKKKQEEEKKDNVEMVHTSANDDYESLQISKRRLSKQVNDLRYMLEESLEREQDKNDELDLLDERLEAVICEKDKEMDELRLRLEASNAKASFLATKLAKMESKKETSESGIGAERDEEHSSQTQNVSSLEPHYDTTTIEQLQRQNKMYERQFARLVEEREDSQKAEIEKEARVESLQFMVNMSKTELSALQNRFDAQKSSADQARASVATLEKVVEIGKHTQKAQVNSLKLELHQQRCNFESKLGMLEEENKQLRQRLEFAKLFSSTAEKKDLHRVVVDNLQQKLSRTEEKYSQTMLEKEHLVAKNKDYLADIAALRETVQNLQTAYHVGTDPNAEQLRTISAKRAPIGDDQVEADGMIDQRKNLGQSWTIPNGSRVVLEPESATRRDMKQAVVILERAVEDLNLVKEESNAGERLFGCFPLFCPVWNTQKQGILLTRTEDG